MAMSGTGLMMGMAAGQALAQMLVGGGFGSPKGMMGGRGGMTGMLGSMGGRGRSGGQSGVDRAAMDIAREYGIPLCGWCPKHFRRPNPSILYINLYLRTIPELHVTSRISSGTPNNLR